MLCPPQAHQAQALVESAIDAGAQVIDAGRVLHCQPAEAGEDPVY